MAMVSVGATRAPAWQTDELGEEWVEDPPSPPAPAMAAPGPGSSLNFHPARDINSINAKRGSLRGLGHASARSLPLSRANSEVSRNASGQLSPPASRSSSSGTDNDGVEAGHGAGMDHAKGTFVVKEGVEDDRGHHLARAGGGKGKGGKDIFGALPLEKLFQPPSPPTMVNAAPAAASLSPPGPPPGESADGSRRLSHPYAPINPSRLSKSVTPSNVSTSYTYPESHVSHLDGHIDSILQDLTAPQAEDDSAGEISNATPLVGLEEQGSPNRDQEQEEDEDSERGEEYERTIAQSEFSFQYPPPEQPTFDISEISHSTLHRSSTPNQPTGQDQGQGRGPANLRLFRSTYDTYTREHLSALVDSIAIESPPTARDSSGENRSTPSGEGFESPSPSSSGSGSGSDARSSKRLRLSPPSPTRRAMHAVPRDWGAHGRAMMDRIRDKAEGTTESGTSISASGTGGETDGQSDSRPDDVYSPIATQPLVDDIMQKTHPGHRSNPSTTSSGYLRAAEDLMAKIKNRVVSDSASSSALDTPGNDNRRPLSETDSNAISSELNVAPTPSYNHQSSSPAKSSSAHRIPAGDKGKSRPSPRRLLRRISASEAVRRAHEEDSDDLDDAQDPSAAIDTAAALRLKYGLERRNGTAIPEESQGGPARNRPTSHDADDLDRFLSASTHPTATYTTATSSSFVKHTGPPPVKPSQIRMIKPTDVQGLVGDRVGKMRYDPVTMRWIRDRPGGLGTVTEGGTDANTTPSAKGTGSDGSEDVFAGLESWREDVRSERALATEVVARASERASPLELSSKDDRSPSPPKGAVNARDVPTPVRPAPHHANSAPPILTPAPAASSSSLPLRSALRQPNSFTPGAGQRKRAGWHADLTPGPAGSGERRSVSFSDGKKSGKIMVQGNDNNNGSDPLRRDLFDLDQDQGDKSGKEKSFMASARTRRIKGMLEEMEDLSIDEADTQTPSKPPRQDPLNDTLVTESTIPIQPFRSRANLHQSRSRRANETLPNANANATFLTECSFGVAHDKLVGLITDVQPFEPYWETLASVDLRSRGVESLARLKEFLPALQDINLDDNRISYLSGIPSPVITLSVARNRLTSLTSVGHLLNLQVLDLSSNQLDSVTQLGCLTHLKELKVDHNIIESLEGIMGIESLTSLSAVGNRLDGVDFTSSKWSRLTTLNVSRNEITEVKALHQLASLRNLNLDENQLTEIIPATPLSSLRTLRISSNDIAHLDLDSFPKIRTLYADDNRLKGLVGSSDRLESLSVRNQRGGTLQLTRRDLERVKRLYISGNALPVAFVPGPLENLNYLEAVACSVSSLPRDLTTLLPNIQVLNLNYNQLTSLARLSGMAQLRRLSVVGCRLETNAVMGVGKVWAGCRQLRELDLRMNPGTLGFYLPLLTPSSSSSSSLASLHASLPKDKSYIQPTTRVTHPHYPDQGEPEPTATWQELDARFRKSLNDEWYTRRLLYRGMILGACPRVEVVDGLEVHDGERRKAEELLRRAGL